MASFRTRYDMFDGGLWVTGPSEFGPPGTLRRATGVRGRAEKHIVSRYGSSQVTTNTFHSMFSYLSKWFAGTNAGTLRRVTVSPPADAQIHSGLNGKRLTFVKMPPSLTTSSSDDYLFVAGGGMGTLLGNDATQLPGSLFKVKDNGATIQRWGITPPPDGFAAQSPGTGTLQGTYLYYVTFLNSTTGARSNSNPTFVSITLSNQNAQLVNLPVSNDPQVDKKEIWRTVGNQAVWFLVTSAVANATTTYTDNTSDLNLGLEELPLDNIDPAGSTFDFRECAGPHAGRLWWTRDQKTNHKGRVYYSPIGRPEAVDTFLDVTPNDAAVLRIIPWNASIYAFTNIGIVEIYGVDTPFQFRLVYGAPGTTFPWSIVPTPYGIAYRDNQQRFRLFDGVQSQQMAPDAIAGALFGSNADLDLTNAQFAGYGRDEYMISDGVSKFMGLYLTGAKATWRNIANIAPTVIARDDNGTIAYSFGIEA